MAELLACIPPFQHHCVRLWQSEILAHSKAPAKYLSVVADALQWLGVKEHAGKSGLVKVVADLAFREADAGLETRALALALLTDVWLGFGSSLDTGFQELLPNVYRRSVRDSDRLVRINAITCCFRLLEVFSAQKKAAAPQLYKSLIFALCDHFSDQLTREHIYTGLSRLYKQFPSMPVDFLLDPLSQVLKSRAPTLVQFDLQFLNLLGWHPKLHINQAVKLMQFYQDTIFEEHTVSYANLLVDQYVSVVKRFK